MSEVLDRLLQELRARGGVAEPGELLVAAGVLASTVAVACSISFGINMTLSVGAACYLLLVPAALALGLHRQISALPEPA